MAPVSVTLRVIMARPKLKGMRLQTIPFDAVRVHSQWIPEYLPYSCYRIFPSMSLFDPILVLSIFFGNARLQLMENGLIGHLATISLRVWPTLNAGVNTSLTRKIVYCCILQRSPEAVLRQDQPDDMTFRLSRMFSSSSQTTSTIWSKKREWNYSRPKQVVQRRYVKVPTIVI